MPCQLLLIIYEVTTIAVLLAMSKSLCLRTVLGRVCRRTARYLGPGVPVLRQDPPGPRGVPGRGQRRRRDVGARTRLGPGPWRRCRALLPDHQPGPGRHRPEALDQRSHRRLPDQRLTLRTGTCWTAAALLTGPCRMGWWADREQRWLGVRQIRSPGFWAVGRSAGSLTWKLPTSVVMTSRSS